jgi:hypothetical protein
MGFKLTRVDFPVDNFDVLVEEKGYRVVWTKHVLCPCQRINTGQAEIKCPLCKSMGSIYIDPLPIRGIVSAIGHTEEPFKPSGQWVRGGASITVRDKYLLGYYDKLVFSDLLVPFSQIVLRADDSDEDELSYPAEVFEIVRDVNGIFVDGTDFEKTETGGIRWLVDYEGYSSPEPGANYTVRYQCKPTFIVMDIGHAERLTFLKVKYGSETLKKKPIQAMIQLEFLIEK